ncbi:antirestriction protein ArdA [Paraburkholderia nemoris]|uniref:antirestriction protein ArdA n=1 Tax=Paraburkholderia nemoris TaxID=2793076 RepID=UPI0038BAA2AC
MTTFYACPYNLNVTGFYFESHEQYLSLSEGYADSFGNPVEEFEIQFIDGDTEDAQLVDALRIAQSDLEAWFDSIEELRTGEKAALFFLVANLGQSLADALENIDDVQLFDGSLIDAATDQFDDLYPTLPQGVRMYIDCEAYARDCELNGDFAEIEFSGATYTVLNANDL